MEISPITPTVGAEISGANLAELGSSDVAIIKEAFFTHHVLVFRNQTLT